MELWIRSQDKTVLINIKTLFAADKEIRGYYSDNPNWFLGNYKTRERALEVLDEIQKYIADSFKENEISQFFGTTGKSKIVYEMPQE